MLHFSMVSHFRYPDLLFYVIHHKFPLTIKYWSSVRQYDIRIKLFKCSRPIQLVQEYPSTDYSLLECEVRQVQHSLKVCEPQSLVTFLWPPILTLLSWHFVTGSNKSGWGNVVSPTLLWLCTPSSDQTRRFIMSTWLFSCFMEWDSILARSCVLCFQKVCAFYYKSTLMLFKVIWYLWYCYLRCCWKKIGILYCK